MVQFRPSVRHDIFCMQQTASRVNMQVSLWNGLRNLCLLEALNCIARHVLPATWWELTGPRPQMRRLLIKMYTLDMPNQSVRSKGRWMLYSRNTASSCAFVEWFFEQTPSEPISRGNAALLDPQHWWPGIRLKLVLFFSEKVCTVYHVLHIGVITV